MWFLAGDEGEKQVRSKVKVKSTWVMFHGGGRKSRQNSDNDTQATCNKQASIFKPFLLLHYAVLKNCFAIPV